MRILIRTSLIKTVTFAALLSVPSLTATSLASAQVVTPPSVAPAVDCVTTGTNNSASPRSDRASGETMSDKLAQSKGVICPPGSGDDIRVTPPDGGRMRVIPPPVDPQPPK
jgi:hypothetical protein